MEDHSMSNFEEVEGKSDDITSIWYYFLRGKKRQSVMCKLKGCSRILKTGGGSTSTLHNHLRMVHKKYVKGQKRTSSSSLSVSEDAFGSTKELLAPMHCLLCNEDIEEHSPLDQTLCDCLCRLFSLDIMKSFSFAIQHFCSECNGKIRHINSLYRELETLEAEIGMHYSQFIESIKSQDLGYGGVEKISVDDERRRLLADIIQENDSKSQAGSQASFSETEHEMYPLIQPKVECFDMDVPDDYEDSEIYSNFGDDIVEPNQSSNSDFSLAKDSAETELNPTECLEPVRRSSRRTRQVNYSNYSLQEEDSNDDSGEFENDEYTSGRKQKQSSLDRHLKSSKHLNQEKNSVGSTSIGEDSFQEVEGKSDDQTSIWHYFLRGKTGQSAMCKLKECSRILKTLDGSTSTLHNHLRMIHNKRVDKLKKLTCPSREQSSSVGPTDIREHSLTTENTSERANRNGKICCPTCSKRFPSRNELKYHLEYHLPDEERSHVCSTCGKGYPKASILLKHQQTHRRIFKKRKIQIRPPAKTQSTERSVNCPEPGCDFKFQSQGGMKRHVENYHSNSEHAGTLKWLSRKRDPSAIVKCKECGKVFKSNNDLKYHAEVHLPHHERSFQCPVCGRGFPKASMRDKHTTTHEGEEAASSLPKTLCTVCGTSVINIVVHMRSHKAASEYHCSVCDKPCNSKRVLQYHQLMHSGVKPFQCDKCPTTFRSISAMKRHSTIHTDEKKFLCAFCGKAFRLKQNYEEHQHVHTKELPHRCNYCGRRFHLMDELIHHRNEAHDGAVTSTKSKQIIEYPIYDADQPPNTALL